MTTTPRRVRKRDGRRVPFDARKIADAIEKAFQACGEGDRAIAEELASVVALTLSRERREQEVPSIEEIQDLVERVLMETGHTAVAKAYILYREKRAQLRDSLAVRRATAESGRAAGPRAVSPARTEAWSKGKIVAALMMEAELPRDLAESVASRVEQRVFASGMSSISTALVRELVDHELFERGFQTQLRRQTLVGLPKYDLREGLRSGFFRETWGGPHAELVAPSAVPEWTIARSVLGKFALEEVLPPAVAERHVRGDLYFEGLDAPHRDWAGSLSLAGLRSRKFGSFASLDPASDFEESLDWLRELLMIARRSVAGLLALTDVDAWLDPWLRAVLGSSAAPAHPLRLSMAERVLRALTLGRDVGAAVGQEGELALSLPCDSPWCYAFVASRGALAEQLRTGRSRIPWMHLLPASHDARLGGIASLADLPADASGVRAAFGSSVEQALAPGVRIFSERSSQTEARAFGVTGACAVLNLPRLAYQAGSWNEGRLLELLTALVDDAMNGIAAMAASRRDAAVPVGAEMPSPSRAFALSVVGLREATRRVADGSVEIGIARAMVQTLVERARAVSRAKGLRVFVEPWLESGARSRFERLDAEFYPDSALFRDGDRVRYSPGMLLSPVPGMRMGALEGDALRGIEAGVLPSLGSPEETWGFVQAFGAVRRSSLAAGRAGLPGGSPPPRHAHFPRTRTLGEALHPDAACDPAPREDEPPRDGGGTAGPAPP